MADVVDDVAPTAPEIDTASDCAPGFEWQIRQIKKRMEMSPKRDK